ncbi:MAG TPA: biopolymer transporter ExbD [Polyangiaceae bacterium]|jgi:biopolymer transport protein ExbD|nr:biopolymer transporter ExbD [Polyangiaceae bacterium]
MASVNSSRSGRTPIVGINVTPFVDITLVLLIIMMVSATYIVSQSLKVELPKTASSDDTVARIYAVTIDENGALSWNDKPVDAAQLVAELKAARAASKDATLVISADERARHGSVVHVIDEAKVVGITKFAINVQKTH